jgi:ADP-heptose:LPS heptosyltransferase
MSRLSRNPKPPFIVVLSFRTYGDYVLKAPFFCVLRERFPDARMLVVTNRKGGALYPLLDSRLELCVLDHDTPKLRIVPSLWRIGVADRLFVVDDSRTSLILAAVIRARSKTGWYQNVSRLYGENGFFEWTSVVPWLSRLARVYLKPARLRLPEEKYEGDVELELLGAERGGKPLAAFRSPFAVPPHRAEGTPYIYCAADAGWRVRRLTTRQWTELIAHIVNRYPGYRIVLHGADEVVQRFTDSKRVIAQPTGSLRDLFNAISAATLVIAADSFALHLASLYDVPTIGYFGPAHPHRFRPTGPGSKTVFHRPACSPCLQSRGELRCAAGRDQCSSLTAMSVGDFARCLQPLLHADSAAFGA